ncbi:SAM-dependent methyltransferase [Streptomyces polyrhachis]|uniref:SAM-dependent methyltransferase n=1 Tax=Streptomyces polyrhachis TaxID=1282885 RepID=A0ABW2GMQ0_9ACTN
MAQPPGSSGASGRPRLPDGSTPHSTRTYDYLLGGKDNYEADRELMEENLALTPDARVRVRAQRLFLARAVRTLVGGVGIRQLLDIGCGLPMPLLENVHEIAHRIAPGTRVAYVDNNPVAVAHMGALHTDDVHTAAFHGDLREPEAILRQAAKIEALDLTEPVGVLLVSVLHCLPEEDEPAALLARLCAVLPPGSHVVATHISADLDPRVADVVRVWAKGATPMVSRTRAQLVRMLDGLELLEPGLVPIHDWRPDGPGGPQAGVTATGNAFGAVGRTP